MSAYFITAGLLLALSLVESELPQYRAQLGLTALALVIGFVALRHETGYDWMVYQTYFENAVDLDTAIYKGVPEQDLWMEPFYLLLNIAIKTVGGDFALLLFAIAVFDLVAIHAVVGAITDRRCLVWLVYFCLILPAAQMSAVRYGIASSLVLIALLRMARRDIVGWLLFGGIATGFHLFAAVSWSVGAAVCFRPRPVFVAVGLVLGVAASLFGLNLVDNAIGTLSQLLPGSLAEKIALYMQGDSPPAAISVGATLLIFGDMGLLVAFMFEQNRQQADPFVSIALWLTLLSLATHLLFAGFPVLWNRVMCVSLPWQMAALMRCRLTQKLNIEAVRSFAMIGALAIAGFAGLAITLNRPEAKPLVPYQSLVHFWLYGDKGDGRARSEDWMLDFAAARERGR